MCRFGHEASGRYGTGWCRGPSLAHGRLTGWRSAGCAAAGGGRGLPGGVAMRGADGCIVDADRMVR